MRIKTRSEATIIERRAEKTMSKLIYILSRSHLPDSTKNRLVEICKKLTPDNISFVTPRIQIKEQSAYAVLNPAESILAHESHVLLGNQIAPTIEWFSVPFDQLDGSFALFRNNEGQFETATDPVGSRTIWYYFNDEVFVASTSQRAIATLIGSFEFDERVIPWMLSSGSLGPGFSWDKRIKRIPPDTSVILDKRKWELSETSKLVEFKAEASTLEKHKLELNEVLASVFEFLDLDLKNWVLPLSGGYDSRAILLMLNQHKERISKRLKTITWGLRSSIDMRKNDANVAKRLADSLGVQHQYFVTDLSSEPLEKIIERFLSVGEGRIDHISGYMDGFEIWKTLFENGVQGVVRGDEGFGWESVSSDLTVRHRVGCAMCSDFANLRNYREYGFHGQELPAEYGQRNEESLYQWRDRLYHVFRIPTVMAALSDLKLSYVELTNPLLSRRLLQFARKLPDNLRTEKRLFKEVVVAMSPNIEYATLNAIESPKNLLRQTSATKMMKSELTSDNASSIFPAKFLEFVLAGIKEEQVDRSTNKTKFGIKSKLKQILPNWIKNAVRDNLALPSVDGNVLAFRVYLICRMKSLLMADSCTFDE